MRKTKTKKQPPKKTRAAKTSKPSFKEMERRAIHTIASAGEDLVYDDPEAIQWLEEQDHSVQSRILERAFRTPPPQPKSGLSPEEAAKIIGVSSMQVRWLCRNGRLFARKRPIPGKFRTGQPRYEYEIDEADAIWARDNRPKRGPRKGQKGISP